MRRVLSAMVAGVVSCCLWIGCADNSGGPAPDTNSLWYVETSANPLPDTLYQGAEVSFELAIGDSDGSQVSASVSGVPASFFRVLSSGDTTFVIVDDLAGDSLQYDSLYTITITATGEGEADSVTLSYLVRVGDSTRLGGIRRFAPGTWWTTVEYDTVVTDSIYANGDSSLTREARAEHHMRFEVVSISQAQGAYFYSVASFDTLMSDRSVTPDGIVIRHTDTSIDYSMPVGLPGLDTVRVKYLELPPVIGSSWVNLQYSYDTAMTYPLGTLNIPLVINFAASARRTIAASAVEAYGGLSLRCLETDDTSLVTGMMTIDTTLEIAGLDTINQGDTASYSTERTTTKSYFSDLLSAAIRSSEVKTVRDTNYYDVTVVYRTQKKETLLTSYYDPRRNLVFRREP